MLSTALRVMGSGLRLHVTTGSVPSTAVEKLGVPLLLIPGALGTAKTDFGPQLQGLPDMGVDVVSFDPRGYGLSVPPRRDFPNNFYKRDAEDAADVMSSLGYSRFVVGGWSDGANAAALLAAKYPDRVMGLVIWGGNPTLTATDLRCLESTRNVGNWSERMRIPLEQTYSRDGLQQLWTSACDAWQTMYTEGGEVCAKELHKVTAPTLILHGAKDPMIDPQHPMSFKEKLTAARVVEYHEYPDGKHNIHLKYAETHFNPKVVQFLFAHCNPHRENLQKQDARVKKNGNNAE